MENNRWYLCELPHITHQRITFLKEYCKNFISKKPLQSVYLEATWIFSKGAFKGTWQDDNVKSCRKRHESTGKRSIVLHVRTENGFVENVSLEVLMVQ